MRTEKSRVRRSIDRLQYLMRRQRHLPIPEQAANLNSVLRGHFAYYGVAGNFRALQRVHRIVERYWHRMLCSRSRKGYITWDVFQQIKARLPLVRPKLFLPYQKLQAIAVLETIFRRAQCGKPARYELWEPGVGDHPRRPGGRGTT